MNHSIQYEIDLSPFGKHTVDIEFTVEAGEPEYNGDNGSAPSSDASWDLVSLMKDGVDVYDMISDGFPDQYKKLCDDMDSLL